MDLMRLFFTSQLVMPTEDIKAALHNKSKIIKQIYKHRQRMQVRSYSKTLVTLVIEALRKEGKITLSVESFHNDTAFCQTTNLGWSWSSSKRDVMQQRLI